MTFSFCFCFKRDRATYSVSSNNANHNSIQPSTTVTLAPLPVSNDLSIAPAESHYEKIIGSSGDGEIRVNNDYRDSTTSMEYGGYTKLTPIRSQQQSFDDDTQLYATVDKTRTSGSNGIRTTPNATAAIAAAIRQGSSPASTTASSSPQAIFSPSSHLTGYTMTSQAPPEHPPPPPPPPPPPLPPLLPQVYGSAIVNNNDSSRRPHYDEVITRESLQYRAQRLQMEEQQQQQIRENYYSSVNSERGTTTGSELYAEIANGSASGTVHQNQQSHYYSRPTTGNGIGDDLSERYATVIETIEQQPTTNRIYQEVDTMKL
ncbi:unnamed protein product [Adineta steineri]|uniref:Uncharacterized protein n=1 Tax=Adineta steineri TaxID=433720 RepID=A0A814G5D2_9BILA|nr:unnamed protein product [Adineta steineri]CAF1162628.1 unnamed protein product [Adineta steineri]